MKDLTEKGRTVITKSGRLNFANMTDDKIELWKEWFERHNEQEFELPRERSYFRVNEANLHAEIMWRAKDIPF